MNTKVMVKTKNVKRFVSLMENLKNLPPNIPKLALIYGSHGLGKTKTLIWWATKNDAIYIRAYHKITQNGLLQEIVKELGGNPVYTTQENLTYIINNLIEEPRIILVDEVDYLFGGYNAIEILRDIQDNTGTPIVLAGMSSFSNKLSSLKHFKDRLYEELQFEYYDESDIQDILSQITNLKFSEDSIKYLATRTNQFRKIVQTLEKLEKKAKTNGLTEITETILKGKINERQSIKVMPPVEKVYA